MTFSWRLKILAFTLALALSAGSGILAWSVVVALGWHSVAGVAMGGWAAFLTWRAGQNEWTSFDGKQSPSALQFLSVMHFFGRRSLIVVITAIGASLGYAIAGLALKLVSIPGWLTAVGHAINSEYLGNALTNLPPDSPGWSGVARYCAACAAGLLAAKSTRNLLDDGRHSTEFRRGRKLLKRWQAQFLASRFVTKGQPTIFFGGVGLPDEAAATHLCFVGATGSGKSRLINSVLEYACATIGSGEDHRAIVFDPKRDMIPALHGMNVRARVYVFNPFDQRSVAWWLSRDCKSYAVAVQLAAALVPEDEGANRFFSDAARELVLGVMLSLMKRSPEAWTLRDVLLILRNNGLLRQVLLANPDTQDLCQYFDEPRTYQNIRSSLSSKINRFAPIAACWDRATESLALSDWIVGESVLVLGYDPSIQLAMKVVNQAIYQRVSELLLSQGESLKRRVWHFVDEAKELGKLDALPRLATFGRGAGNRLIIGFQDIEGLRHVYGRELAHELTGQCASKSILRLDSPETASWASKIIADCEVLERHRSGMQSGRPESGSLGEQINRRETVLTGELLDLDATNRLNGLTGYFVSPYTGVFRANITEAEIDRVSKPQSSSVPGFIPRPPEHQLLRPFDDADLKRLRLNSPPSG